MASPGLQILQNWKFNKTGTSPHGVLGVAVLQILEINKTAWSITFVKGTPGVSVLSEQLIVKTCFDACPFLQFQKFHKRK